MSWMQNPLLALALPYLFWGAAWLALSAWLYKVMTPERFLSLFESEKSLSIRLVLATVWTGFVMHKVENGLSADEAMKLMYFPEVLLVAGVAKVIGRSFAERAPEPATQIKADKAQVDATGDVNISTQGPRPEHAIQ